MSLVASRKNRPRSSGPIGRPARGDQVRSIAPRAEWRAELGLEFVARAGGTVLSKRVHRGPLQVQRPFFPEGPEVCHVYLLHPPGGLVAGDVLHVEIATGDGAHALVTTPAATKVYRSGDGQVARQEQRLRVAAGSSLEWLPQETILFESGRAELSTVVEIAGDGCFFGWEIVSLGRPAFGEPLARGTCRQRFELSRDGRPLVIERLLLVGGGEAQAASWGLAGHAVTGTLVASGGVGLPEDLRAFCSERPPREWAGITEIAGAIVARYLGSSAERARDCFTEIWRRLRPGLLGRPASAPRIWQT